MDESELIRLGVFFKLFVVVVFVYFNKREFVVVEPFRRPVVADALDADEDDDDDDDAPVIFGLGEMDEDESKVTC